MFSKDIDGPKLINQNLIHQMFLSKQNLFHKCEHNNELAKTKYRFCNQRTTIP